MQKHTYRIDPIRAEGTLDPEMAEVLQGALGWSGDDWKDVPGRILGWRLSLSRGEQAIEQRDFQDADNGFNQAQEAGKEWLASHGNDDITQWMASSFEAMRRMNYDPNFRHQVSKHGF